MSGGGHPASLSGGGGGTIRNDDYTERAVGHGAPYGLREHSQKSWPDGEPSGPQPGNGLSSRTPRFALRRKLLMLDVSISVVAWSIALIAVPTAIYGGLSTARLLWSLFAVTVCIAFMHGQRLYQARICAVRSVEVQRLAYAVSLTGLVLFMAAHVFDRPIPARFVLLGSALAFVGLSIGRVVFESSLRFQRSLGRHLRPVVLVGLDEGAEELQSVIREHPEFGLRIRGVVGDPERAPAFQAPWLDSLPNTLAAIHRSAATGAVVVPSAMPPSRLNSLVRELLGAGLHVHLSSGLRGVAHRRLRPLPLAHEPLFYLEPLKLPRWHRAAKRTMDIVVGFAALVLSSPLIALGAVAIRLEDAARGSRGPILFRQRRVGWRGKHFTLYKLRTMVPDAEQEDVVLHGLNDRREGPLYKNAHDPRVTRVGKLLRAASVDELPQLINVLSGDMSLVGPRPALPHEVDQFDETLRARLQMPPGITGLWQVEARDNPAFGAYRRLDLFYVENWSMSLDFAILYNTVHAVALRTVRVLKG